MRTDDAKSETLQFKVTDQERRLIEKCAQEEGTTVSKYEMCIRDRVWY